MLFTLKHYDTPLLRFSAENGAEPNIEILSVNGEARELLPLDLPEITAAGLESWIRHRLVPQNRACADSLLTGMGLSFSRPVEVLRVSMGLSLNDCYWITEEGYDGTFAVDNLYENRFSRELAQIAFTGSGSCSVTGPTSSPEFTTSGTMPKCWRRVDGEILLFKGGTTGASNSGNEPYSEFYASQIGAAMGFNVVHYSLSQWKDTLCSTCGMFTDMNTSFVPAGRLVRTGGMKAVRDYYHSLGRETEQAFREMLVFDALIFNTDRHSGNFGLLVDGPTNRIIAPAPLFDHGNSLLNSADAGVFKDKGSVWKYAKAQQPCAYEDFVQEAKAVLTYEQRNKLRRMLNFRFKHHIRYNLDTKRLKLTEYAVQQRAAELLAE